MFPVGAGVLPKQKTSLLETRFHSGLSGWTLYEELYTPVDETAPYSAYDVTWADEGGNGVIHISGEGMRVYTGIERTINIEGHTDALTLRTRYRANSDYGRGATNYFIRLYNADTGERHYHGRVTAGDEPRDTGWREHALDVASLIPSDVKRLRIALFLWDGWPTHVQELFLDDVELETNGTAPMARHLRYEITSLPKHGKILVDGVAIDAGTEVYPTSNDLVYVPDANYPGGDGVQGTDSIGFVVWAGNRALAVSSEVEITVDGVNDGPWFTDLAAQAKPGGVLLVDVARQAWDAEGDDCCTIVSAEVEGEGTVHIGEGMKLQYRAPPGAFSGATVKYHAKDGHGVVSSEPGIVHITPALGSMMVVTQQIGAGQRAQLTLPAMTEKAAASSDGADAQVIEILDVVDSDIVVDDDGPALYSDLCAALASIGDAHEERLIDGGMTVLLRSGVYLLRGDVHAATGRIADRPR